MTRARLHASSASSPGPHPTQGERGLPDATIARLPVYLRALRALAEHGTTTVSSDALAEQTGVGSAKLRRDLSCLGSYGTRGVGYDVALLVEQISLELGQSQDFGVVVVGVGNLGHALAGHGGFASRGFRVVALVDADPSRTGEVVAGLPVRPMADLADVVRESGVAIGVVATPGSAAQEVCDALVAAGVTSILNFAPQVVSVPEHVVVRRVDLSIELQILAYHQLRRDSLASEAAGAASQDVAAEGLASQGAAVQRLGSRAVGVVR